MKNAQIRIVLADDHSVVRQGFRRILEGQPDMAVVGEAVDGFSAVAMTEELMPDLLVVDVMMPGLNGIEAARQVTSRYPRTQVIALSMQKDAAYVRQMLKAGARGYVLKECTEHDLVSAIREVAGGKAWLSPDVCAAVLEGYCRHVSDPVDQLSTREREVLRLIADGRTNKEIASQLGISVYTVEAHRSRVMDKLNLHSSAELVRFAIRHGIAGPA